jgi:ERCC4-type nuclease
MIIQDTREQTPFCFEAYGIKTKVQGLKTGDYTFVGFEDKVCIERKKSVSELAQNIGSDWKRFSAELQRMSQFEHKYIVCEFPVQEVENYPNVACIPKRIRKYIKIRPAFIIKRIEEIENDYGITFFFCNSTTHAEEVILELYYDICEKSS